MLVRTLVYAAMLVPLLVTWPVAGAGAQNEPVKRTELLRTDIVGVEGREAVVFTAEIVPGGVAPKHTHPGDEVVYVLQGSWVLEREGKNAVTLKPGELIHLPAGLVHQAKNGSDKEVTKALVFLVSEKGKPLVALVK
jgi:quercetin dioxygenase-like cupin family protein